METAISFDVDGQRLHGMLHLPDTARPAPGFPSVVILHGYTGNRGGDHRLLPLLSRRLMARGVASLRFDFRGSGESEGDFSEMTVSREVEDVKAAFAHVRRHPDLDPQSVMLLGFSMGGLVAALAAPEVSPSRLALWAPALPELWLSQTPPLDLLPDVIDSNGWPLGKAFLRELADIDPLASVSRVDVPVRVFHGERDEAVPLSAGERYAAASGAQVVVIPATNHTFDSLTAVGALYDATVAFLSGETP